MVFLSQYREYSNAFTREHKMLKKILFTTLIFNSLSVHAANYVANSDITDQVNSEIKKAKPGTTIKIPAGNFKVNALKSINLKSNISLELSPKTTLNVIPNKLGNYQVFNINNVQNVRITGGTLIGDKYTHLGNSGEWGMGIEIKDSRNITISDININKMWGDAIYVGTNGKNSTYNIKLSNIKMDDNRRQGLTIISVDTLNARNLRATNTSGAKPSGGIDIEPNNGTGTVKNITLENIVTSNNAGPGIQIGLSRYNNPKTPVSIKINNHTDTGSQYGILLGAINAVPSGRIEMKSINYSKSKNSSCFNSWSNKKFNVDISGDIGVIKTRYCMAHLKHPNIMIKRLN
ncbi:hypothetical protein ACIRA0001_1662 [Acinetobacter radioresistens SK82]|uniref:Right handed beta helix domain-containing protein n=2 Tax=Acinetobacter radioresistens TaxID=40216 RepID=A0ABP2GMF6_ACIRA|nr:hypothetical protein ACIRA0001_1662 [Acinetobacter radioresistens SK82]